MQVKISTTFPALCKCDIEPAITFLESTVVVTTIDSNGQQRSDGGDPMQVTFTDSNGDECDHELVDRQDGEYIYLPWQWSQTTQCLCRRKING